MKDTTQDRATSQQSSETDLGLADQQVTDEALQLAISRLDLFASHSAPAFLASSWSITAQVVVDSTVV
jgi:hypothetical protein